MAHDFDDDDDYLKADDLDELPAHTLQDLEHKAILSTQYHATTESHARPSRTANFRRDISDVSRKSSAHQASAVTGSIEGPRGSDYGFDDEDVINLDEPSTIYDTTNATKPFVTGVGESSARPIHFQGAGSGARQYQLAHRTDAGRGNGPVSSRPLNNGFAGNTPPQSGRLAENRTYDELQNRIDALEQERTALLKATEDAKATALSKAGEIAIVRSNHDKATKEYERKSAVVQKLHAEEIEKQKRELDISRRNQEKIETKNKFLEHDLAQEVDRARQNRRTLQDKPVNAKLPSFDNRQSPAATPKRGKIATFRDGFDDDEVVVISPSKVKQKPKLGTPKAAGKRKRPVDDSPMKAPALDVSGSEPPLPQLTQNELSNPPPSTFDLPLRPAAENQRFLFMQRVLNHRPLNQSQRTFEILTRHKLPSKPDSSLSSTFHDRFSTRPFLDTKSCFSSSFCKAVIEIWNDCLTENYYDPINLLVDLLHSVLAFDSFPASADITENVIPTVIATVDIVALPVAKSFLDPSIELPKDHEKHRKHVDVLSCLHILETVAGNSCLSADTTARFWQCMEFDFVLLMLHKVQPLAQVRLMLQLLALSPLEDTFGPICHDAISTTSQQQQTNETGLLDRLTSLLIDKPQPPGSEPLSRRDILHLRLDVLDVLFALILTDHGTVSLRQHRYAIGRLIRFLNDAITNLYPLCPTPAHLCLDPPSAEPAPLTIHTLTIRTINLTTRLLHTILFSQVESSAPSNSPPTLAVNIHDKLAVIYGGSHKFSVSLSRLAFSDQLVLDAGIEDATVDAAHGILDAVLSPEEGEAFGEVFGVGDR